MSAGARNRRREGGGTSRVGITYNQQLLTCVVNLGTSVSSKRDGFNKHSATRDSYLTWKWGP
eukprot:492803-Hanusia_phi.AAC.1